MIERERSGSSDAPSPDDVISFERDIDLVKEKLTLCRVVRIETISGRGKQERDAVVSALHTSQLLLLHEINALADEETSRERSEMLLRALQIVVKVMSARRRWGNALIVAEEMRRLAGDGDASLTKELENINALVNFKIGAAA